MVTGAGEVRLYDTTLRDGMQREGVSLSLEDKLKIAHRIDQLGVHYIEGGFPLSNPKDTEFFRRLGREGLVNARLVAFGYTRRKNTEPAKDANLRALLEAETPAVAVVGKSWDFHVAEVIRCDLEENLAMIRESVAYLKDAGREVFFDAEHFFDGYKSHRNYALATLQAAVEGGADWLCLCDTNGGTLPGQLRHCLADVRDAVNAPLAIHAHNDADCGVANSLVAVESGCLMVQGTINGYGERCGNANLCSIIPALKLKMGRECVTDNQLELLTEVSHYVSEITNINPDTHQPYVGQSAFAHKGGLHIDAIKKNPQTFEHIDPGLIGNVQRVVVSELSGRSTVVLKAKEIGVDLAQQPQQVAEILTEVKDLEHAGYHFEAADGSFEILLRKATGMYSKFFRLESFRVLMEKREDGRVSTEATIKLHVDKQRLITTAEGNGPVNALDNALRLAIQKVFPALEDIHLTDYKVRVLDEKKGTAAITRVLIESSDGEKSWGTIGVSENIIEASWQALVDGIEYGLLHKRVHPHDAEEHTA